MTVKPLEITARTLLRSANPAATDLLLVALESEQPDLRKGAARALVLREDPAGHRRMVERFPALRPDVRRTISGVARSPLVRSLDGMISPVTPRLARRAAEVARLVGAVSLVPRLVAAAEWSGESGSVFADSALSLTEQIEQAVNAYDPEATSDTPYKADPAFDRRAALNALGPALERYARHGHRQLINAFLLLAPPDEPVLQALLRSPEMPAHEPLLTALRTSRSRGAFAVLGAALVDPRAPTELVSLAAERYAADDLNEMFSRLGPRLGLRAKENCRRVGGFAWLDPERIGTLVTLNEQAQAIAVQLAASSAVGRGRVVEALRLVLSLGETRARVAAARAIETLPPFHAIKPLSDALTCGDPAVLVVVIPMLRSKEFPGATSAIVPLLSHADERVRHAAGRALSELSFMAYRDQRHHLTLEERRRVGQLVDRADPLTRSALLAEARCGVPRRRLEALEMIEEMGLGEPMLDCLLRLAGDHDSGVRAEAVRLLGAVGPSREVLQTLADASEDRTPAVSRAARKSFQRHGGDIALALEAAVGALA